MGSEGFGSSLIFRFHCSFFRRGIIEYIKTPFFIMSTPVLHSLFVLIDDMLLLLGHIRHRTRLRVATAVVLLAHLLLAGRILLPLVVVHLLGHLPVVGDALDLGMRRKLLLQRVVLALGHLLPGPQRAQLLRRIRLPQTNVHLVRPVVDVPVVLRPPHTRDVLHSLRVVHVPRVGLVHVKDAQRLIVGARHKLLARRRIVHVNHSGRVALVHLRRVLQPTCVECVQTVKRNK